MDRVGLIVELSGMQDAMSNLKSLKKAADELNKKKIALQVDKANASKEIAALKTQLAALQRSKETKIKLGWDTNEIDGKINDIKSKIASLTEKKTDIQADIQVNTAGIQAAKQELQNLKSEAYSVRDAIATIGGGLSTIGGSLQSLGSAFGGNILSTMATTLTAYGTLLATQGLSSSVSRYDTFKTFPALMEQVGYSSTEAQSAISKMNDAVLGLPTGLNEIVESSKQYILALNDIDKGTDLAIAANNAFLANASDSAQVYQGMRQIQDILAKGELRSMEWMSLFTALGTSIQPIAEQMGYGADAISDFKTQLQEGAIDAMDFIDAMIEVGTGTGALVERANIQKETLNATLTNIKNAFSITGQAILQEMDDIFTRYTGQSLPENIKKISDYIKNELKPAITGWMDANSDRIMGFFQKLRDFDWMKLASSIGHAVDNLVTTFGKIVDAIPEGVLDSFITFAMVYASPVGKAFSMLGNAISSIAKIDVAALKNVFSVLGHGLGNAISLGTGSVGIGIGTLGFGAVLAGSAYLNKRYENAIHKEALAGLYNTSYDELIASSDTLAEISKSSTENIEQGFKRIETEAQATKSLVSEIKSMNKDIQSMGDSPERDAAIAKQKANIEQLKALNPDLSLELDANTGALTDQANAILKNADAYMQLAMAQAEVEQAQSGIETKAQEIVDMQTKRSEARQELIKEKALLDRIQNDMDNFRKNAETYTDEQGFSHYTTKADEDRGRVLNDRLSEQREKVASLQAEYDTLTSSIDDAQAKMQEWANKLGTSTEALESVQSKLGEETFSGLTEEQQRIISGYEEMRQAAEDSLRSQVSGFQELAEVTAMSAETIANNLQSQVKGLEGYNENLQNIFNFSNSLDENSEMFSNVSGLISDAVSGGFANADVIAGLSEAISAYGAGDSSALDAMIEGFNGREAGYQLGSELEAGILDTFVEGNAFNDMLQEMPEAFGELATSMSEQFSEAFTEGMDTEALEGVVEQIDNLLGELDTEALGEGAEAITSTLDGIKESVSGLQEIDTAAVTEQLSAIFESLSGLTAEDGGAAMVGESMQAMVTSLTQLGEVDLSGAMGGVEDLTGALPSLTSALDETAGAAEGASASANNAQSSITSLADTASSKAGSFSGLIGAMGNLSGAFSGAAASANALSAAINAIPSSKTVTVNYQQTGTVSPIGPAKGGYITPDYKAVGGPIAWEPMGTDTIPAMLTPGEFVIKKKAVDKFRPVLERINNMDLNGALDAMFSGLASPKPYVNVYNTYNRDFHGTVNQYMNNAGRNYTERRAYRFLDKL